MRDGLAWQDPHPSIAGSPCGVGIDGGTAGCAAGSVPKQRARGQFTRIWITVLKRLHLTGPSLRPDETASGHVGATAVAT